MSVLYIAGPMTGMPDHNYPAFDTAAERLRSWGHLVLNPTILEQHNPTPGTPQPWDWYMRRALRMLLDAEGVALLPGWASSRGATIERDLAMSLRMPVRHWRDWRQVTR